MERQERAGGSEYPCRPETCLLRVRIASGLGGGFGSVRNARNSEARVAMETLFAFCITLLFSIWIWDLKREVWVLRRERPVMPDTLGHALGHAAVLPGHLAHAVPPPHRPTPPDQGRGIPIWTIE